MTQEHAQEGDNLSLPIIKFDEYEFEAYCAEKYTAGMSQESACEFWDLSGYEQTMAIRDLPNWQLLCWLAEYLAEGKA